MEKEFAEKIKQIKNHVDIVKVISRDIPLTKYGKNFFGRCPFCDGSKSLCVSQEKQFAYCFACAENFDIIGYFQKVKKMSFAKSLNEVKCFINLYNELTFKKIQRALLCLNGIVDSESTAFSIKKQSVWITREEKKLLEQFSSILLDLMTDYYLLTLRKKVDKQAIDSYSEMFYLYSNSLENETDSVAEMKMRNLFSFLVELCDLIKGNDYNLGGMVYFNE